MSDTGSNTHEPGDDRARWEARYLDRGSELDRVASTWIVERSVALPEGAVVLDVAGGTGRNAAPVARSGRVVVLADFVEQAVAAAVRRHPRILGVVADAGGLPFRAAAFDAVIVVSYLDRSAFKVFAALLKPGGTLLYETFTRAHIEVVARGRARGPTNPAYLLEPGELSRLVAPLELQEHEERLVVDEAGERHVARVMARRA
jgi:SAM-dependent methyltransferase